MVFSSVGSVFGGICRSAILGLALISMGSVGACAADVAPADAAPSATEGAKPAAVGLSAGDWLLRARIMGFFPLDETSDIGLIGGRIETPEMVLPDGEIGYFITDRVSLEIQGGVVVSKPKIRESVIGDLEIGSIWTAALSGAVQYHFRPQARLNPYVGAGISVSWPVRIEPGPGVADFDILRLVVPTLQIGLDYQVSENWFANTSVKYSFVPGQTYTAGDGAYLSDLDLILVGAGIGYRF